MIRKKKLEAKEDSHKTTTTTAKTARTGSEKKTLENDKNGIAELKWMDFEF